MKRLRVAVAFSLTGILFFYSFCNAQDIKNDLVQMNKTYLESKSYSTTILVKFYSDLEEDSSEISYDGYIKKQKKCFISELNNRVVLYNKSCGLIIDDNSDNIVYSQSLTDTSHAEMLIDSTLFTGMNLNYVSNDNDHKTIRIKYSNTTYDSIDIVINSKKYFLEKVTYYYKKYEELQFPKVEIYYLATTIDENIPASIFSESNFITIKNSVISGVGTRSKYKVYQKT